MSAALIDGKKLARMVLSDIHSSLKKYQTFIAPGLATIIVGSDSASELYVANKIKAAKKIGINSFHYSLKNNVSENQVLDLIEKLNEDERVDGILVQLPLPQEINRGVIIEAIDPKKDVDGFHPLNLGALASGDPKIIPCTPRGILEIIRSTNTPIIGKHVVIVGKSITVGMPLALLLLLKGGTVSITHKQTVDLFSFTKQADILIVAAGSPHLINKNAIKKGAVVIDVGINRNKEGAILGDVDFSSAKEVASYITPVPGGVGPMTIAMLMQNTFECFQKNRRS